MNSTNESTLKLVKSYIPPIARNIYENIQCFLISDVCTDVVHPISQATWQYLEYQMTLKLGKSLELMKILKDKAVKNEELIDNFLYTNEMINQCCYTSLNQSLKNKADCKIVVGKVDNIVYQKLISLLNILEEHGQKNESPDYTRLPSEICQVKHHSLIILTHYRLPDYEIVFTKLINLLYNFHIFSFNNVYMCLYSCSSDILLDFTACECKFLREDKSLSYDDFSYSSVRKMFINCVQNKVHILSSIYEYIISKSFEKSYPEKKELFPLWLFAHLEKLSTSHEKLNCLPILNSFLEKTPSLDASLMRVCKQKVSDLSLAKWCLHFYPETNVHKLMTLLEKHSSLYALHYCIPLSKVSHEDGLKILSNSMDEDSPNYSPSLSTYQGYFLLQTIFNIVSCGIELDRAVFLWREKRYRSRSNINDLLNHVSDKDYEACRDFYIENVASKWLNILNILTNIMPICYRLEIMENIFSLIFLKHTNLSDELILSVDDDEDLSGVGSLPLDGRVSGSVSDTWSDFRSLEDYDSFRQRALSHKQSPVDHGRKYNFKTEEVPTKETQAKDVFSIGENSHLKILASTTPSDFSSGSSICDFSKCGYLINSLVSWDILLVLHEVLSGRLEDGLFCHGSLLCADKCQNLHARHDSLMQRVTEGICRLQILCDKFREIGSIVEIKEFMTGTLFHNKFNEISFDRFQPSGEHVKIKVTPVTRKKSKRGLTSVRKPTVSIVNLLLATPKNLLTCTLRRSQLQESEEIITKHELANTTEARELHIVKLINEFLLKFDSTSELRRCRLMMSEENINVEETDWDSDVVYNEAIQIQNVARQTSCESISEIGSANILIDLSLTNSIPFYFAKKLINHTIDGYKSCSLLEKYSKSEFEQKLNTYWSQVSILCDAGEKVHNLGETLSEKCEAVSFNSSSSLQDVILSAVNLNSEILSNERLSIVVSSLCSISNICLDHQRVKLYSSKSEKLCEELNEMYRNLIKTVEEASTTLTPHLKKGISQIEGEAHMWSFLSYLKLLNYTCTKFSTKKRLGSLQLNIINQKPMTFLSDILFREDVDPQKLEPLCARMQIDLLSVISQTTCQPLPLSGSCVRELSGSQLASFGCIKFDGKIILNGGEMTCERCIHGEIAGRDILSALLDAIKETLTLTTSCRKYNSITSKNGKILLANKEIKEILKSTAELASVDLSKLASTEESTVFYVNLANLMILHAGILNYLIFPGDTDQSGLFAGSALERNISLTLIGYVVGQLGFLSLYDIMHKIIGFNVISSCLDKIPQCDSTLNNTYIPSSFPDFSVFLVSQGLKFSPKISVYFSDSFETDANNAIASYFDHLVDLDWAKSRRKEKVVVTAEIYSFLKSKNWSSQVTSLINLVPSDYSDYLQVLDERADDLVTVVGNSSDGCQILVDVHEDSSYNEDDSPASIEEAEPKLVQLKEAPARIENYVRKNSLILLVVMETLCSLDKPNLEKLTNKIWSFKTKKFFLEYLSHLLCLPRISNSCHIFDVTIGTAVMQPTQKLNLCLEKLQNILNRKHKNEEVMAGNLLIEGVKLINCLSSLTLLKYPHLDYIRNMLSVEILNTEAKYERNQLWDYVYQITDTELMFKAGKHNYKKWPMKPLCHWLSFLLSLSSLKQDDYEWADEKMKQVNCYQKMVDCNVLDTHCWQEVAELSLSEPLEMIQRLLRSKNYELVIEWSQVHELTERSVFFVTQSKLNLYLDKYEPNFAAVRELLLTLDTNMLLSTVGMLLFQQQSIPSRKFIITHLLDRVKPGEETNVEDFEFDLFSLRQELMALILINDVAPPADRPQLDSISTKPYLIIEQWIMNLKVGFVEKGLSLISSHLDKVQCLGFNSDSVEFTDDCLCWNHFNLLIENYGKKALDISDPTPLMSDSRGSGQRRKFSMPEKPPLREEWQPNEASSSCSSCETVVFSLFNRRHHCRGCGRVVCYSCSTRRGLVAGYGDVPVGICKDCHHTMHKTLCDATNESSVSDAGDNSASSEYSWYLSFYSNINSCVRQEFSYEYVPSVNLCQALLNLHRNELNAAIYVLNIASDTIVTITDFRLVSHPAMDSNLVLNMLHTLLSYGKVRFSKVGNYRGIAACEYYIMWTAILQMIDKCNVASLLPSKCLENMCAIGKLWIDELRGISRASELQIRLRNERNFMRKLRDNFVGREMWSLALNVATKTGQETAGIWGAWGMASLKVGDFAKARQCFSKVLKPFDKCGTSSSSLLNEILTFLQSKPFDPSYFTECSATTEEISAKAILGSLDSLSDILAGKLSVSRIQCPDRVYDGLLSPCFKTECEYYLKLYGCHRYYVRFLVSEKDFKACIKYIFCNEVRPIIFVEEVLMPSFKKGTLPGVLDCMRGLNQGKWYEKIILFSCHWLEVNKHFNCLLRLQKALGDYLRGGISLIKMYVEEADSFTTICSRKHYLLEAVELLEKYLERNAHKNGPTARKKPEILFNLPIWNVHRQLRLIKSQIDVAELLSQIERSQNSVRSTIVSIRKAFTSLCSTQDVALHRKSKLVSFIPTLFQTQERLVLAVAVAIYSTDVQQANDFCYDLVEMNSVSAQDMLKFVPATLLLLKNGKMCMNVIKGIFEWGLVPPSEVRGLLIPSLNHAAKLDDQQPYEQLMKFIPTMDEKVKLYVNMGRLKSAYVAIVQQNSMDNMINLQKIAREKNNALVDNLCTKWITCHEKIREKSHTDSKFSDKSAKSVEKHRKRGNFGETKERNVDKKSLTRNAFR